MPDEIRLTNESGVVPQLMAHDAAAVAGFWRGLGFDVTATDGTALTVTASAASLGYAVVPGMDLRTTQCVAFVLTTDVDALHAQVVTTGIWSLGVAATNDRDDGFAQRMASGEGIARVGAPVDREWGMREFRLFDPSNNLIRFAQDVD